MAEVIFLGENLVLSPPPPLSWWALMLLRQESTAPCWGRDNQIRISLSIFLTYQGVDGI